MHLSKFLVEQPFVEAPWLSESNFSNVRIAKLGIFGISSRT